MWYSAEYRTIWMYFYYFWQHQFWNVDRYVWEKYMSSSFNFWKIPNPMIPPTILIPMLGFASRKSLCSSSHSSSLSSHSRRKAKAKFFFYRSIILASCQLVTGLPGHGFNQESVDTSSDLWPNLCIARWTSGSTVNGQTEATAVVEKAREKAIHFCVVSLAENRFRQCQTPSP